MRVDSGFSSLSRLQAQQAFNPAQRKQAGAEEAVELQAPAIEIQKQEVSEPGFKAPVSVDEIRDIARRAGYMDVSESDIRRAYVYGESLLTDYRV